MAQNGEPHILHILNQKQIKCVFYSDFRHLNNPLTQKPNPMPTINEILLKLEFFKYASSFDLKMVYYHIRISVNVNNLFMIILLWGKYRYKHLPMGVRNSPDIF